MNKHSLEQIKRYEEDLVEYGILQEGEYKGIRWLARRPNALPAIYWCGYVKIPDSFLDNEIDSVEFFSHGEFTGGFDGMTGFDCAHWGDFKFLTMQGNIFNSKTIYKDFPYVQRILFDMIDRIIIIKLEKFFKNRIEKKCTPKIVSVSHLIYQNKSFSNQPILESFISV